VADQVHDVRITLDGHELGDLDRAERRDAPDVVPSEVNEHDVLGALLGVGQQRLGDRLVLGLGDTSRTRPRERAHVDAAVLQAHQHLGRRTDHRRLAEPEKEEVGRRVDGPQRAVHGERVGAERRVERRETTIW